MILEELHVIFIAIYFFMLSSLLLLKIALVVRVASSG